MRTTVCTFLPLIFSGTAMQNLGDARIIPRLLNQSADTLPLLCHRKLGDSMPDPAVQNDDNHAEYAEEKPPRRCLILV